MTVTDVQEEVRCDRRSVKSVIGKLEESRNHILSQGGLLPDWCAEPAAAV